jgi:hypothetical protein
VLDALQVIALDAVPHAEDGAAEPQHPVHGGLGYMVLPLVSQVQGGVRLAGLQQEAEQAGEATDQAAVLGVGGAIGGDGVGHG